MTTHEGHDHPATKAARAACRRAGTAQPTDLTDRIMTEAKAKAKRKPRVERATYGDPALPHEFDSEIGKPERCYVCRKNKFARVHTEGPADLAAHFRF